MIKKLQKLTQNLHNPLENTELVETLRKIIELGDFNQLEAAEKMFEEYKRTLIDHVFFELFPLLLSKALKSPEKSSLDRIIQLFIQNGSPKELVLLLCEFFSHEEQRNINKRDKIYLLQTVFASSFQRMNSCSLTLIRDLSWLIFKYIFNFPSLQTEDEREEEEEEPIKSLEKVSFDNREFFDEPLKSLEKVSLDNRDFFDSIIIFLARLQQIHIPLMKQTLLLFCLHILSKLHLRAFNVPDIYESIYSPIFSLIDELSQNIFSLLDFFAVSHLNHTFFDQLDIFYSKSPKQLDIKEEEKEEDDEDILSIKFGICCYIFHAFNQSTIPLVFSVVNLFLKSLKMISYMFDTNDQLFQECGFSILKWFIRSIPEYSLISFTPKHKAFIDSFIFCIVHSPLQPFRKAAFDVFIQYINLFNSSSKFVLYKTVLSQCQFQSFSGLLIHTLKNQIDKAWPLSNPGEYELDNQLGIFASQQIFELLPLFFQYDGNFLQRIDILMSGLNLYRFLLIKDKETNYTGVWTQSKISSVQDIFFAQLKDGIRIQKEELCKNSTLEARKAQIKNFVSMGLPELCIEEIEQAQTQTQLNLQMLTEIITRIEEITNKTKQ